MASCPPTKYHSQGGNFDLIYLVNVVMGGCSIGLMVSMRRKLCTESKQETNNTRIIIRLTAYFILLNWKIF